MKKDYFLPYLVLFIILCGILMYQMVKIVNTHHMYGPSFLIAILMASIGMIYQRLLKITLSNLPLEKNKIYKYYGETENGKLILGKRTYTGEYEDGFYNPNNVEWFEDPIINTVYIYKKTEGRYFLCLYIPKETLEQEK